MKWDANLCANSGCLPSLLDPRKQCVCCQALVDYVSVLWLSNHACDQHSSSSWVQFNKAQEPPALSPNAHRSTGVVCGRLHVRWALLAAQFLHQVDLCPSLFFVAHPRTNLLACRVLCVRGKGWMKARWTSMVVTLRATRHQGTSAMETLMT